MNNLLEQMARVSWKSRLQRYNFYALNDSALEEAWRTTTKHVKEDLITDMKAALEVLKNPPEEFLEAVHSDVYEYVNQDELRLVLQAAINQTLKTHEQHTERFSAKDDEGFDFPTSGGQ